MQKPSIQSLVSLNSTRFDVAAALLGSGTSLAREQEDSGRYMPRVLRKGGSKACNELRCSSAPSSPQFHEQVRRSSFLEAGSRWRWRWRLGLLAVSMDGDIDFVPADLAHLPALVHKRG